MNEELSVRALEVFDLVVRVYMQTGVPIGSEVLKEQLEESVSSATIRNILALLQKKGFVRAPHISSGRLPTDEGLRFFVDAMLAPSQLSLQERRYIDERCYAVGCNLSKSVRRATEVLSDLSGCVGLMLVPRHERIIEHIDCVPLSDGKIVMLIVGDKGYVENRIMWLPPLVTFASFKETVAIFNSHFSGHTLEEISDKIQNGCLAQNNDMRVMAQHVIMQGLGAWFETERSMKIELTDNGQLEDEKMMYDMAQLVDDLKKESIMKNMLRSVHLGKVQTFIGAMKQNFTREGCALVLSGIPCMRTGERLGVLGVVGHRRMDYARAISLVGYTAQTVTSILNTNE